MVRNNSASVYERDGVFSSLGFDKFISIENMDIESRKGAGWAKDSVLTRYIMDTLQQTEKKDVIYTISVQG
ncbi:LTA synthase family protein, partial [Anaerobutyricum soehngenii]|nr:LTA synthase family protein [Anaerobutyricum soehngenii]